MRKWLIVVTGAAIFCAVILVLWQAGYWQATLPLSAACRGGTDWASEVIGWLASALTLVAFSMRQLTTLRLLAMGANLAFIAYGSIAALAPVLALHLLLLPCNLFRLYQALTEASPAATGHGAPELPPFFGPPGSRVSRL